MASPIISIVTPVKNGSPYLQECLDSIIAQSEERWELCIVDDHSTDKTWEILQRYATLDSRIRPFKSQGVGIIHALQTGYLESSGSFITRMDADDVMLPHKLEVLHQGLIHQGLGHLAIGGVEYFSDQSVGQGYQVYADWLNQMTQEGSNWSDIYKECVIPSPCWMLYREDFDASGGFDSHRYPEDYDLCFRMYYTGLKVIASSQILHRWRDYPDRTSRNDPNYADNRFLSLKLDWFSKIHLPTTKQIVIWGAGSKGKLIAKHLIEEGKPIQWITNNQNKIGRDIYGQVLEAVEKIRIENSLVIIAVANPSDQQEIIDSLKSGGLLKGDDFLLFC